ncbi:hypothetical protein PFLUV_G00210700 [Perca fluviatilis]|uniref:Uncharacterized protein n=1 Tax=Perca fluviatilis TaxID=8168 RepID=A0A6A5EDF4_PERFL|nr:hypothetical protein PFLUV_G00210700 [Perca fluviatilis]
MISPDREIGLLPKLDSVIGSSENPNEAMSITAAARLPRGPQHSQQAGPSPACSDQMKMLQRWKVELRATEGTTKQKAALQKTVQKLLKDMYSWHTQSSKTPTSLDFVKH